MNRFKFIDENRQIYPIQVMCKVLEVSRSAYYSWCNRLPSARQVEAQILADQISEIHDMSRRTYGSPRIHAELTGRGVSVSPNRVARIMRKIKIKAKTKGRFKTTTDSKHNLPVAPNLLNQNFKADQPDRIWCADLTYLRTMEGWVYLAVIIDLFSRRIVGWSMRDNMRKGLVLEALEMALKARNPGSETIHHSDRGSQYCSDAYRRRLDAHGIRASMSRKGNCYDNAVVESFFHTLKTEHVYFQTFFTKEQARQSVFEFIEVFYNRIRIHSGLDFKSPVRYEQMAAVSLSAV